ncbi:MAG: hypothetical protein MI867_29025 [Pseudomonadales bacterium]|nr:hypothetical protein [Pseudomonadales bacterium]
MHKLVGYALLFLSNILVSSFCFALPTDWEAYFRDRQADAQAHAIESFDRESNNIYRQLVRFETGIGPLDAEAFRVTLEKLAARRDTSDFQLSALVRMLYQYGDSPLWSESEYGPDLKQDVIQTIFDFKYWIDEPGLDNMIYWSENHQILFHSSAYLIGQMFPDQIFSNSGMTGAELKAKHEPMLKRWIYLRAKLGFSEWHSNNYYEEDIGPLINLVDFAEDPVLVQNANGVAQLLLLDIALYSHGGLFTGSHGRSFLGGNTNPEGEATRSTAHLVFAQGGYNREGSVSFSPLSVTKKFLPEPAIVLIGRKDWHMEQGLPQVWNDHARMGFDPSNAQEFGIGTDASNLNDVITWWGNGGYILPEVVPATFEVAKKYGLFESDDFFQPFAGLVLFWDLGILNPLLENPLYQSAAQAISLQTTQTTIHHKPSVSLSVALDKSKGNPQAQNHAWGAALNGGIRVFSNHPLLDNNTGSNMDYFTGAASFPRIAQHEDVAIIINKPKIPLLSAIFPTARITHAFFPVERFDEVRKVGRWHFGRKDDGYIALYSHNRSEIKQDGRFANSEIVAKGMVNLWICETGWAGEDGSFDDFVDRVSDQRVKFHKLWGTTAVYESDHGTMRFGWQGNFRVDGNVIPLDQNPRYRNPFLHTEWKDDFFEIQAGELRSIIEFDFLNHDSTID